MQHLAVVGALENSPRDIEKLVVEVVADVKKECKELIMEELWKWAWPHIRRKVSAGMAEWYKNKLLKEQFNADRTTN